MRPGPPARPLASRGAPRRAKHKAHQARHIKVDEAERSRASHALTVGLRLMQCIAGRPSAPSKRLAQPEANTASYSGNSAQSRTTATDGTPGAPLTRRTPKTQGANWGHAPNLSLGSNTLPSPDSRSDQRHPTSGAPQSDRRWPRAREGSRHQVPLRRFEPLRIARRMRPSGMLWRERAERL